jgi:hypothetical protein
LGPLQQNVKDLENEKLLLQSKLEKELNEVNLQRKNDNDRYKLQLTTMQETVERGQEDIQHLTRSIYKEQLEYVTCVGACEKELLRVIQATFATITKKYITE